MNRALPMEIGMREFRLMRRFLLIFVPRSASESRKNGLKFNMGLGAVFQLLHTVSACALLASSCLPQTINLRSRTTEFPEDAVSYFDRTDSEVPIDKETIVSAGSTKLTVPEGLAETAFRVRISRRDSEPKLRPQEGLVLGSPKSDIVDIELYQNDRLLSSEALSSTYQFSQTLTTSEAATNIGLFVVSDPGTSSEKRTLLLNSDLQVETVPRLAMQNSVEIIVSVRLKLTNATIWLATYTEDAPEVLEIGKAASLDSVGGSVLRTTSTFVPSTFDGTSFSINSNASYANSNSVTLSLTSTNSTEMYITNMAGCADDGSWEVFSSSKSWTLSSFNSVSGVYAKFKNTTGSISRCMSSRVIHDDIPPSTPGLVIDGTDNQSLLASPAISWTASTDAGSGVWYYEIAIGSTAGGTDVKSWTAVGNTTSNMISDLSLTANSTYYASVRSIDAAGNISPVSEGDGWTATGPPFSCPPNYLSIPANTDLGTSTFCVMKFNAKNVSGVATSQAALTPWVNIARGTDGTTVGSAWKACKDLGAGYDLLTNAQWQAIARNIESVPSNWSNSSSSGTNSLNRGNSDGAAALAADASDGNGCAGLGSSTYNSQAVAADCGGEWHTNKRTHTLSNGETIWDMAGNVWQWVQESYMNQGTDAYVSQLNSTAHNLVRWGPAGNYTSKNSGEYGGLGRGWLNYSGGGVARGGRWQNGTVAGVFASNLSAIPTASSDQVGFRCVAPGGP
jgi:hypothetical protein